MYTHGKDEHYMRVTYQAAGSLVDVQLLVES